MMLVAVKYLTASLGMLVTVLGRLYVEDKSELEEEESEENSCPEQFNVKLHC